MNAGQPARIANTLGLAADAERYAEPRTETELQQLLAGERDTTPRLLGGASNVVLAPRLPGLTIRLRITGIDIHWQANGAELEVGGGERWQNLVRFSLAQGLCGLENLTLIPGSVGAAPVQNIGAYGRDLAEFLVGVTAVDRETGRLHSLSAQDCRFAYRDSRFRREPESWCITRVRLRLPTRAAPQVDYAGVEDALERAGVRQPRPLDVAEAVARIRRAKLPDPRRVPNAGSFFKNPLLSDAAAATLLERHPDLPHWAAGGGRKFSAAALIDRAGWKRRGRGGLGVWRSQPLVLVNTGRATAAAVLDFARAIQLDVEARFGTRLEQEPLVVR